MHAMARLGRRGSAVALCGALALASVACASAPGMELRDRMQIIERAQQPPELLRKARAFASIGDFTRAEQYLKLAVQGGAEEARIVPLLVEVCVLDQRYLDAVQHVEGYLRHRPEDVRLRYVLASLEAAVGNNERARSEYEKVLARDPDNADVHYALATVLRDSLASLQQADRHFREYLRLRPGGSHAEEARASLLEVVP